MSFILNCSTAEFKQLELMWSPVSCRGTTQRPWPAWRPACPSWPEPSPPPDWTWSAPSPGTWCAMSCTGPRPWAGWFTRSGGSTRARRLGPAPETQRWSTIGSASCSSQVCGGAKWNESATLLSANASRTDTATCCKPVWCQINLMCPFVRENLSPTSSPTIW